MQKFTTSLENIRHPSLVDLVSYWQQLEPSPHIPHRRQFNPVDVPQCLRHIILVDVLDSSPRYFIRLAGSSVNPAYQRSITGSYLEEILGEADLAEIIPQYDYTVGHQIPTYMASSMTVPIGKNLQYERVVLPMTSNSHNTDKLLVGVNFSDVKQQLIDRPSFKL
ncbi:MAG: PAS domain-containing protein [Sneathiella sp.]|nr:PAS domain-containing protein [Sneathiella sp.]